MLLLLLSLWKFQGFLLLWARDCGWRPNIYFSFDEFCSFSSSQMSLHTMKMTTATSNIPSADATKHYSPQGAQTLLSLMKRENASSPSVSSWPFSSSPCGQRLLNSPEEIHEIMIELLNHSTLRGILIPLAPGTARWELGDKSPSTNLEQSYFINPSVVYGCYHFL